MSKAALDRLYCLSDGENFLLEFDSLINIKKIFKRMTKDKRCIDGACLLSFYVIFILRNVESLKIAFRLSQQSHYFSKPAFLFPQVKSLS